MPIPRENFLFYDPHPYMAVGAPYHGASPWMLRIGVLQALLEVQKQLASLKPDWKIMFFDAYRPHTIQEFMVEREFQLLAKAAGINPETMLTKQRQELEPKVFRLWGEPCSDPITPPLHSTGSAVDITLADETGKEVNMGSPIDENSDRSNPDYFVKAADQHGRQAHSNRLFLRDLMLTQGFSQMRNEWWHFGLGDQYSAWLMREADPASQATARYGRADLVK